MIEKFFDLWNRLKQKMHFEKKRIYFHEREIFYASLGKNIGYEQDGKGVEFGRPVVILKKFNHYCCLIVPLTSQKKEGKYYFPFSFAGKTSYAILSQIRFIDAKRLADRKGMIAKKDFLELKKAMVKVNFFHDFSLSPRKERGKSEDDL